jgi:hypothetical protein
MLCRKLCLDGHQKVKLQNKFDIIISHIYAKPPAESQALAAIVAYMAKILRRA